MRHTSLVVLLFALSGSMAVAASKPSLTLSDAKIFMPLKGSDVTAGYGVFKNNSEHPVTLKLKSVKPFKGAEMHETVEKNGKASMHPIDQAVIAPHQTFEFKPGAHHIMLFDPTRPLKLNETLRAQFEENGKPVSFPFKVVPRN